MLDGSDHRQCCRRRQVSNACLRWCAGLRVTSTSFCLSSSARDITACFSEGKALLPGPPRDVQIKEFLGDNNVKITWEAPIKNPDLVQWYRVFWRPVGSRDLKQDQTDWTYFELTNLNNDQTYEFVVKSGNRHGLSLISDPLIISPIHPQNTK